MYKSITFTRLATLLVLIVFSATAFSVEIDKNENKINRSGDYISDANATGGTDGDTTYNVEKPFHPIDDRRLQAQLDTCNRFLERNKRFTDGLNRFLSNRELRHEAFLKQVEQRRLMTQKLMDDRRDAARLRRIQMMQKLHQTSTPSAEADDLS